MEKRKGQAKWQGDLPNGKGIIRLPSQNYETSYSFSTRFEDEKGSNPEEFIGAAHAACFSMAFSNILTTEGYQPESIDTTAEVQLSKTGGGFAITEIELFSKVKVNAIEENTFMELAKKAKETCPVSQALAGVGNIEVKAELL
jgi:lipoyl-dependent peroxiredoxin